MPFWTSMLRYIALEQLKGMGADVLARGRRVFADELAAGKSSREAARLAARAMTRHAADKGRSAGRLAGRMASGAARNAAGGLGVAARTVRCRMEDLGGELRDKVRERLPELLRRNRRG